MNVKKFLLFLSASALLISCSNKLEQELQSLIGTEQTIYASLPGTKTTTDGTSTSWSDQDQMTVFYTNSDNGFGTACFTYTNGESFSGKVKNLNKTTNDWYSLYPYSESNTNVKAAILTVPGTQTQNGNGNMSHIAGSNDPLWGSALNVAYGSKPSIQMHHVLAIAKFTVTNTESSPIKVSSIEFTSPFPMTGTFSADMTDQNFTWATRSYSKKVTLNVSNAQEIQPGFSADFYASFLPGSADGEYTIKVNASKGSETISSTKTTTTKLSFVNGVIEGINYNFVADDEGGSEQGGEQGDEGKYYVKVTSEPQSWDGTYLFVDETSGKAFAAFTSESGNKYATSVTINNGKIEATSALAKYALAVTDAGKKHANDNVSSLEAYNVRNSDGQYIYWSSSFGEHDATLINDNDNIATNSSTDYYYYHTFKYSGGVQVTSAISTSGGSAYYLGYSNGFAYEEGGSSNRIQLYKLDDGTIPDQPSQPDQPEQGGDYFVKVTSAPSNWDGTYLVVDESGKAFTYNSSSSYSTNVTINNGRIAWTSDLDNIAVRVTDAGLNHPNVQIAQDLSSGTLRAYNVQTKSGQYIYASQSEIQVASTNTKDQSSSGYGYGGGSSTLRTYYHVFHYKNNAVYMISSGDYEQGSSSAQYYYSLAYSSNKFAYGQGSSALKQVQLYKLNGSSTPGQQTQSISFAQSSVTWTLGNGCEIDGAYSIQGLSGTFYGTVSYTSSNPSVATISGNNLKVVGTGTTTITANVAASGSYSAASASYTLTINPAGGTTSTGYQLLTAAPEDWSGSYLIVSADKSYLFNGEAGGTGSGSGFPGIGGGASSSNRVSLSSSDFNGNTITNSSFSQYAFTITKSGNSYYIKKGNNYYYCSYSSNSSTGIATTTSQSNAAWTFEGVTSSNGFLFYQNENSSNQYIYYKSSDNTFKFGGSGQGVGVLLYKNGNTTPDTPVTPTPSETSFNLENSTLTTYLDRVATEYTNSNYSTTIVESITGRNATLDLPNPVTLSWSGNATSISIYEGSSVSGTAVKTQTFNSSSSVEIFNLVPGKTYTYSTSNGQTGTFNTTGRRRMIKVSNTASTDHARNCRDLGGIVTAKGEKLKYGLIYRGTNMDGVTTDEKNILRDELGIKLDVDLRGPEGGYGSSGGNDVSPLGNDIKISNQAYNSGQMAQSATDAKLKVTVNDIITSVVAGNPCYIHCYIGSDRTGYVCMLIEALLGVSKKECDIDYEITSFASRIVSGTRPKEYTDNRNFREKFGANDNVPQAVQDYVVNTLGISLDNVKAFRRAMGVSEEL